MKIFSKEEKAMVLIATLWVIAILVIMGTALAKVSLANLFYIGLYSQKQQAVSLADCGVQEAIARVISDNNFGKSSVILELPATDSPSEYKGEYFLAFEGSTEPIPAWINGTFEYSINNLDRHEADLPKCLKLVSYAQVGTTVVKVRVVALDNTFLSNTDMFAIGTASEINVDAGSVDIDSEKGSPDPSIWMNDSSVNINFPSAPTVTDINGGTVGAKGGINGNIINASGIDPFSADNPDMPDNLQIPDLISSTSSIDIPSGQFVWNGSGYDFIGDNGTLTDTSDDVILFSIDSNGVESGAGYSGGGYNIPADAIKVITKKEKKIGGSKMADKYYLEVNENLTVTGTGNLLFMGDPGNPDGSTNDPGGIFLNESYIYLDNGGNEDRWGDYYSDIYDAFGVLVVPDPCVGGTNMGSDPDNPPYHPDDPARLDDPTDGPFIDKPMYGNITMFQGTISGDGSVYSSGSVLTNGRAYLSSDPDNGVAIFAKGDINVVKRVSSGDNKAQFSGVLYSHGDIVMSLGGNSQDLRGAIITTGNGDPNDTGQLIVQNCDDFNLTFDKTYLNALNDATPPGGIVNFVVSSWSVE